MGPLKILKHSSGLLKVYDMGDDFQIVITKNGYSKERWFSSYTHADNASKAERLDYCINVVIDDEKLANLEFIK